MTKKVLKVSEIFDPNLYQTDKDDLGYLTNFYDNFLSKFKKNPINFLEIGVSRGGSTRLWRDYFHEKTTIYAGDITSFNPIEGVQSIIGVMYSDQEVSKFSDDYFDLIIDDGPHSFESFVDLQKKYYSKLKSGAKLVIEDIIVSDWVDPLVELASTLGYSNCEVIDMTGKQKDPELLERWKNGLYILLLTK
jgi:23S rRNA U2552 (ribose-2'-O)-methylase RlmE/FtsJ